MTSETEHRYQTPSTQPIVLDVLASSLESDVQFLPAPKPRRPSKPGDIGWGLGLAEKSWYRENPAIMPVIRSPLLTTKKFAPASLLLTFAMAGEAQPQPGPGRAEARLPLRGVPPARLRPPGPPDATHTALRRPPRHLPLLRRPLPPPARRWLRPPIRHRRHRLLAPRRRDH